MQNIHAITLDLDDTLWAIGPVIERAERLSHEYLHSHFPRITERFSVEDIRDLRIKLSEEHPDIAHDLTELRLRTYHRLLVKCGYDTVYGDRLMDHFLDARHAVKLFPDALHALEKLSAHLPIVALSNGNADLKRLKLDHLFAGIVNARKAGVAKPDEKIYLAACMEVGMCPELIVHVGDHPLEDVLGAQQAGMKTIWMNRQRISWPHDDKPDAEATSMTDVVNLLCP